MLPSNVERPEILAFPFTIDPSSNLVGPETVACPQTAESLETYTESLTEAVVATLPPPLVWVTVSWPRHGPCGFPVSAVTPLHVQRPFMQTAEPSQEKQEPLTQTVLPCAGPIRKATSEKIIARLRMGIGFLPKH